MRIDLNNTAGQISDGGKPASGSQASTSTAGTTALGNDTAVISPAQSRIQALAAQVNRLPEVRQDKVAALGRAIQDGNYQVSAEQTAEALFSELIARSVAA